MLSMESGPVCTKEGMFKEQMWQNGSDWMAGSKVGDCEGNVIRLWVKNGKVEFWNG